jgi:hypothetical protein
MTVPSPSKVRDKGESRLRKIAATYPVQDQIRACRELASIVTKYADQLEERQARWDENKKRPKGPKK